MSLLAYSNGAGDIVAGLVPLDSYDLYFREVAEAAIAYRNRFSEAPGIHLQDLIDDLIRNRPDNEQALRMLEESVGALKDEVNEEYILGRARSFIRLQRLKTAIVDSVELLNTDDEQSLREAEQLLLSSLKNEDNVLDLGVDLVETDRSLGFLEKSTDQLDFFPCGISHLDRYRLGPARKTLHLMMALIGHGKSWWLMHVGKHAIINRAKALHITLEISEADVCQRYIQSIFSISRRPEKFSKAVFEQDSLGRFTELKHEALERQILSLDDPEIRTKLTDLVDKRLSRRTSLVIKEFPTGKLSLRELEGFLSLLENTRGFVPDVIIVDYADLMTVPSGEYRQQLGELYKGLRGLAVERNVAVVTATQANRAAADGKIIDVANVSEDWSKVMTSDVVLTYNRTDAERSANLARLWVAKARTDMDRFGVVISQNYAFGQFCLGSAVLAGDSGKYFAQVESTNS